MVLLGKAKLSERSLCDTLTKRGFSGAEILTAVSELKRHGLIDDAASARSAVLAWLDRQPASRSHHRTKLLRLGISQATAEAVLDELFAHRSPVDDAASAIERTPWDAVRTHAQWHTRARRAAGRLSRLGFDEEVVESAIIRVLGPQPMPDESQ